jgi:putative aldouronate transport system permease protein
MKQTNLDTVQTPVKKRTITKEYIKYRYLFLMLLPGILYFVVFHYGTMAGLLMAFEDFHPLKGFFKSPWVGLKNFERVFSGLFFFQVFRNTLIISFLKLIFGFPAPIILCLLINEVRNVAFKRSIQSVSYLPHFLSWVVLAGMVIEILSPSRGPINSIIKALGFEPVFFVAEKEWFRFVLVSSSIWKEVGWGSIIYLAAVSGINPELYDVADLDGAGRFRKIWNVTLPSIAPVVIIMFIFATGRLINDDFNQILNLLNTKVMCVGDVISTYTYREGLQRMNYSYATAVGLFKNIISFSLVVITNYIAKKISGSSIW